MEKKNGRGMERNVLRANNAAILRSVMNAIIPPGGAFAPGAADRDLLPRAEDMLARYDPSIRALFPLMLKYIQYSALLHTGRVFTRLDEKKGADFLSSMERSPLFFRRTIILLMKVVTMLSFYEDDEMSELTGYKHGCHVQ